jgi:hypothetical protein
LEEEFEEEGEVVAGDSLLVLFLVGVEGGVGDESVEVVRGEEAFDQFQQRVPAFLRLVLQQLGDGSGQLEAGGVDCLTAQELHWLSLPTVHRQLLQGLVAGNSHLQLHQQVALPFLLRVLGALMPQHQLLNGVSQR